MGREDSETWSLGIVSDSIRHLRVSFEVAVTEGSIDEKRLGGAVDAEFREGRFPGAGPPAIRPDSPGGDSAASDQSNSTGRCFTPWTMNPPTGSHDVLGSVGRKPATPCSASAVRVSRASRRARGAPRQ